MAPPLRHVNPGDKFAPDAGTWNRFVDTARIVADNRQIFQPGPLLPFDSSADDTSGGGSGGGGCNCCDCTSCLNSCTQDPLQIITTCTSCTTAPRRYEIYLGSVLIVPKFAHVSGCVWATANFDVTYLYPGILPGVDTGTYKAILIQVGQSSTLEVIYVSGTDVLKLSSGYRTIKWKADPNKTWSCICNSSMVPAVSPEHFPPNLFAPCNPCVAPVAAPGGPDEWTICHVNAGCVSSLTLPNVDTLTRSDPNSIAANWTAAIAKADPDSCCFTTITNGSGSCAAGVTCWNEIIDNFPSASFWWAGSVCVVSDGSGGWKIDVSLGIGSGASVPTEIDVGDALYSINVTGLVAGTNTLTLVSSTGSLTWPGTLDITVDDCTFEASNYDYGYGCGGGSTDCTGVCPAVSAVGSSPTGFVWTFTDAPASNCSGTGCTCNTIDGITAIFGYPESLGATAEANCIST